MHYIIEEIDEDTSMEDLQKMMVVALIYRLLVCFYEVSCSANINICLILDYQPKTKTTNGNLVIHVFVKCLFFLNFLT